MAGDEEAAPAWLAELLAAQNQHIAQLMGAVTGAQAGREAARTAVGAAAAVVGPMAPCILGKDKIRRYKKWQDWIKDAENKMKFIGAVTSEQKLGFLRSCAGPELTELWEKEARIRYEAEEEAGVLQPAHTYEQVLEETKKTLLKVVSRDRAVIDLFRMEQGNKGFMEFLGQVEDQTNLCSTWERLTIDDLKMQMAKHEGLLENLSIRSVVSTVI